MRQVFMAKCVGTILNDSLSLPRKDFRHKKLFFPAFDCDRLNKVEGLMSSVKLFKSNT